MGTERVNPGPDRDFILIVGQQGMGKSVWAKQFTVKSRRLLVFDPMRSYPVDFDPEYFSGDKLKPEFFDKKENFRVGTDDPETVPFLGDLSYGAGDCIFLMEECGLFFERGKKLETWARRLIFTGRHVQTSVIFLAQRAASVPIDIRSQANRVIAFRQIEQDDVTALTYIYGNQYKKVLPSLPRLACLDWQQGQVKRYDVKIGD